MLLFTACGESDEAASGDEGTSNEQSSSSTATATNQPTATPTTATETGTATEAVGDEGTPSSTEEWVEAIRTANPTNGTYKFLTFEEAQAMVDFTLVMPDPLPVSMEFDSASIALPPAQPPAPGTPMPTGETAFGTPTRVDLNFVPTSGAVQPVTVIESSMDMNVGGGVGDGEAITIESIEVTKYTSERDAGTLQLYEWDTENLNFQMQTFLGPDLPLTADDLEALIAGTIP